MVKVVEFLSNYVSVVLWGSYHLLCGWLVHMNLVMTL